MPALSLRRLRARAVRRRWRGLGRSPGMHSPCRVSVRSVPPPIALRRWLQKYQHINDVAFLVELLGGFTPAVVHFLDAQHCIRAGSLNSSRPSRPNRFAGAELITLPAAPPGAVAPLILGSPSTARSAVAVPARWAGSLGGLDSARISAPTWRHLVLCWRWFDWRTRHPFRRWDCLPVQLKH